MAPRDARIEPGPVLEVHPVAVELGERFRRAGFQLYLVGGAVRDLLLQRPSHQELDFATDAKPEETLRVLAGWAPYKYLQGIAYGTVGARRDDVVIEITTFRKEIYRLEDRHPEVTFGADITQDLSRRDFTVNAMAVRLPEREFVDPFGGVRDLAARRLDTPLEPDVAFGDDPLRMLRAARFVATLEMSVTPPVEEAMVRMADRIAIVSAERIRDELSRLLLAPRPSRGLEEIVQTGLAGHFLPELPALRLEQDPVHRHKDVLRHTMVVIEKCEPDLVLRLAALLHDIGKPKTRTFTSEGVQFHHHEVVGARMAADRLRALRYPNDVVADVGKLIEMHLRLHTFRMGWTDSALRRYVRDAGPLLDKLNQLARADATTRNPFKARALAEMQDQLELRIARLMEEENLERIRPPLDGNEVMQRLGLSPGPLVGEALAYLTEERIERGPIEKEEAIGLLDEWARGRGLVPGS
ncbi:MAG TPA: CCA tRNA nucleotidyltransferase [Actinomycetota bacterium]